MKVFLMNRDHDEDTAASPVWNESDLIQDLELTVLLDAMANGDPFLYDVAQRALLSGLDSADDIRYRQEVFQDFLAQPTLLTDLFSIATEAFEASRYILSRTFSSPENTLYRATVDLRAYLRLLSRLRVIAEERGGVVHSDGLRRFFDMLAAGLDDAFFDEANDHLNHLYLLNDVLMSAGLGANLASADIVLHKPKVVKHRWYENFVATGMRTYTYTEAAFDRLMVWMSRGPRRAFTHTVWEGDERGLRALTELRARGVSLVADALAQSTEHILSFFQAMRAELGFYVGCRNLRERLEAQGNPTCFPVLSRAGLTLTCEGLYDPCLALTTEQPVVGNDVVARDARLIVVTGANHGGKSTFERSVGVSQLMARAGMFAPARALELSLATGLFTHFRREEDETMTSGRLDEELTRMSDIVDHLAPGSLVLFNESFATTNEREGSHVSREILLGLIESGINAVFVTHLYDLAHGLHADKTPGVVFLRAPREDDGRRPFRLIEGEPLPTSFGKDVFDRVFGSAS